MTGIALFSPLSKKIILSSYFLKISSLIDIFEPNKQTYCLYFVCFYAHHILNKRFSKSPSDRETPACAALCFV